MIDMDEHLEELEEGFGDDLAKGPPTNNGPPAPPQRKWTEAELIKPPTVFLPWLQQEKQKKSRWGAETSEEARADNLIAAMTGKFYGAANVPTPKPKPPFPAFQKKPPFQKPSFQKHAMPVQPQPQPAFQPMGQMGLPPMGMMPPPGFLPHPMYGMPPVMPGMPPMMPPAMAIPQGVQYPSGTPTLPNPLPSSSHQKQQTKRRSSPQRGQQRRRRSPSRTPPPRRSRTRSPPGRSRSPPTRRSRSPRRRRSSPRRSPPRNSGGRHSPQEREDLDGVPIEEDPEGNELFVKLLLKKLQSIHNRCRVEALHVDIMSMVKKAVDEEAVEEFKQRRN